MESNFPRGWEKREIGMYHWKWTWKLRVTKKVVSQRSCLFLIFMLFPSLSSLNKYLSNMLVQSIILGAGDSKTWGSTWSLGLHSLLEAIINKGKKVQYYIIYSIVAKNIISSGGAKEGVASYTLGVKDGLTEWRFMSWVLKTIDVI